MAFLLAFALAEELQALNVTALTTAQQWTRLEFRLGGVPAAANPFDPEAIRVDATFSLPSGKQMAVPAFWYQPFQRRLQNGAEALATNGAPGWRVRFTPTEAGSHGLSVLVATNGQACGLPLSTNLTVLPAPADLATKPGFVRIAANNRYFETSQGAALPLIGECVGWHGGRGTYDYDAWFTAMRQAGENYARLWMCPWAFGLEVEPGTLANYRLDRAWQLDYVFNLAEAKGIYLLLCLDYHGMFETQPDYWGGNNFWPKNPYNAAQGGPCANQDAFFTSAAATRLYQQRLRYLVARYGYSRNLLAWEFFNELDNVYQYLNSNNVADWHATMGDWLRANDPCRHLVTTSMTGGSDRPEIWRLPQMDFAAYHSYGLAQPAAALPAIIQSFTTRYQKPVMIGEYGTDWRGWRREQDPYLRGWRQGLWAGALGGSVGTAMPWYWENIHSENAYPAYRALADFTGRTSWGRGSWAPVSFQTAGDPPNTVGEVVPGGQPFAATLALNTRWGPKLPGQLALAAPLSAALAPSVLNCFVHGSAHSDLRIPLKVEAWLGTNAQLVMHLNSVSSGAILTVRRDGAEVFRRSLPNKDGGWQVNDEYNEDIAVALPEGKHLIEIRNAGQDWFYLDWIRLEAVLPSRYAGGWQPSPVAVGLRGDTETLVYVVSPEVNFPANATNRTVEPLRGGQIIINDFPAGRYLAGWYDAQTAGKAGQTTGVSDGLQLALPLPDFSEDLAGRIVAVKEFSLQSPARLPAGQFQAVLAGEAGRSYRIEASADLAAWQGLALLTNLEAGAVFQDATAADLSRRFYRARTEE